MPFSPLFRCITGLTLTAAGLVFVAGCSEEKQAPPPNITVNPPAAAPSPGRGTDAGPGSGGSNAAADSTRR